MMTEDSKAVEAVARAIFKHDTAPTDVKWFDEEMNEGDREWWRDKARAAIAAYQANLEAEGMVVMSRDTWKRFAYGIEPEQPDTPCCGD